MLLYEHVIVSFRSNLEISDLLNLIKPIHYFHTHTPLDSIRWVRAIPSMETCMFKMFNSRIRYLSIELPISFIQSSVVSTNPHLSLRLSLPLASTESCGRRRSSDQNPIPSPLRSDSSNGLGAIWLKVKVGKERVVGPTHKESILGGMCAVQIRCGSIFFKLSTLYLSSLFLSLISMMRTSWGWHRHQSPSLKNNTCTKGGSREPWLFDSKRWFYNQSCSRINNYLFMYFCFL